MAINSLSFCGSYYEKEPIRSSRSTTTTTRSGSSSSYSRTRSTSGDSFERTSTTTRTSNKKKSGYSPLARTTAKILIPVMIYAGGIQMGKKAQVEDFLEAPYGVVINAQQSYEQLAETTGIPVDVILWANEAKDAQAVPKKAIIPNAYDATKEERAELEEKVTSGEASGKDLEKLEKLNARKEKQDELATVYVNDNGKVLIIPNDYVSCEELKEAFGIKDGVIKKYNKDKLSYTWGVGGPEGRGYKDYTGASVPKSGIEIPLSKIDG